jgi:1,4-dihydroxy-2-naphthoate octaprenyltransferase
MVSRSEMKTMIVIFSTAAFISGIALITTGLWGAPLFDMLLFAGFGVLAVIAALRYTLGKNPYGYRGFGDIYVFIFFGLLGVVGSYYMQTQVFSLLILLPATSTGLFSTGVLNLNNLRDEESDRESGKRTIVVIFGARFAKRYHTFLIITGLVAALLYTVFSASGWYNFLWLLVLPVFLGGIVRVWRAGEPAALISELQRLAMATFLFSVFFGITQIL